MINVCIHLDLFIMIWDVDFTTRSSCNGLPSLKVQLSMAAAPHAAPMVIPIQPTMERPKPKLACRRSPDKLPSKMSRTSVFFMAFVWGESKKSHISSYSVYDVTT